MSDFNNVLFETPNRLLSCVDKLPKYDNTNKQQLKNLIDDGACKIQHGLHDEAINCFSQAIKLNPRSLGAHLAMIQGFREQGRDLEALSWGGFSLALADSPAQRSLVYLLMGSTALDTFKHSKSIGHAEQSLAFYQLAVKEDPMELRAVWNSVEVHVEVSATPSICEDIRKIHTINIARKFGYINAALIRKPNTELALRFISNGNGILKRLKSAGLSIHELNEGILMLQRHSSMEKSPFNSNSGTTAKPRSHYNITQKIFNYVLASAFLLSGALLSLQDSGQSKAMSTGIEQTQNSSTVITAPNLGSVFQVGYKSRIDKTVQNSAWDQIERFATVDIDWDELKELV